MSLLSQILRDEHRTLLSLFDTLQLLRVGSGEWKEHAHVTHFMLVEHLKKEDNYLYPYLEKCADQGRIGLNFSSEMKALTGDAVTLFDEIAQNRTRINYAKELGEFIGKLKRRVIREEGTLLPLYDELSGEK